jgi:tRNA(fMet)-specific endonuclease VapC
MVVLDTDVLIEFSRGNPKVLEKVKQLQQIEDISTTIFNLEEYLFGLYKNGQKEEIEQGKKFLNGIKHYDYTRKELETVTKTKVKLENDGKKIGSYDECIAGICIAKNEPLFTLNKKHFERVKELKLI